MGVRRYADLRFVSLAENIAIETEQRIGAATQDLVSRGMLGTGAYLAMLRREYALKASRFAAAKVQAFDEAHAKLNEPVTVYSLRILQGEIAICLRAVLTSAHEQMLEMARRVGLTRHDSAAEIGRGITYDVGREIASVNRQLDLRQMELEHQTPATLEKKWDVFISHASEDKADVAMPLARALSSRGISVWIDRSELTLGDSLRRKIDEGLAKSRFGVVILSHAFFRKDWPQKELDGLFARETNGVKAILPVVLGMTRDELVATSPMMSDRLHARWDDGVESVVAMIATVVRGEASAGVAAAPAETSVVDRPRGLSLNFRGVWWSERAGAYPMFVRFELIHRGRVADVVRQAFIDIDGERIETVEPQALPRLEVPDCKRVTLKFLPKRSEMPHDVKLTVQTVLGQAAETTFQGSSSGWYPTEVWQGFEPY